MKLVVPSTGSTNQWGSSVKAWVPVKKADSSPTKMCRPVTAFRMEGMMISSACKSTSVTKSTRAAPTAALSFTVRPRLVRRSRDARMKLGREGGREEGREGGYGGGEGGNVHD